MLEPPRESPGPSAANRASSWRAAFDFLTAERKARFTRDEQLWMVFIAHVGILAGVWLIMAFLFGHGLRGMPPWGFIACEGTVVAMCMLALLDWTKSARSALAKMFNLEIHDHGDARGVERVKASALLLAYVLQFASLAFLLNATGGPIDSPFAQMALAIAIFTPFIVNRPYTTVLVVVMTMVYYAVFVALYGGLDKDAVRPKPGSFAAVNLFILVLAATLTFFYMDRRHAQRETISSDAAADQATA